MKFLYKGMKKVLKVWKKIQRYEKNILRYEKKFRVWNWFWGYEKVPFGYEKKTNFWKFPISYLRVWKYRLFFPDVPGPSLLAHRSVHAWAVPACKVRSYGVSGQRGSKRRPEYRGAMSGTSGGWRPLVESCSQWGTPTESDMRGHLV